MHTDPFTFSLTKTVDHRPKYSTLVEHPFIKAIEEVEVDMGAWYRGILAKEAALPQLASSHAAAAGTSS